MRRQSRSYRRSNESWLDKIRDVTFIIYDVTWNVILVFLLTTLIGLFFVGGIGMGFFASLVKDEPIRTYASMKDDILNYEETSELYFANNVFIDTINADIYRDETTLDSISDTLVQAVLATEDENFYEHKGIVPKAILRAIIQEATNASMKTGGSTLTQQLIKLQLLTNEVSFDRKAKEMLLALRLENVLEKDEILEAYLNIIPYGRDASGRNIAGIQTAAKGVFDRNADDLTLPQAAFLAGLPQSPYAYTPFKNGGDLKSEEGMAAGIKRMRYVLKRMYDAQFITKEAYDDAVAYDITNDFTSKQMQIQDQNYPYLAQKLVKDAEIILVDVLAEDDGYTKEDLVNDDELRIEYEDLARRALKRNGYEIHSTINKDIYVSMQNTVQNITYLGPDRTFINASGEQVTERVQAAAVLKENDTGRIISFVGGPGFEQGKNEINYIDRKRNNGSTMKPLLDYAPAMELGTIQPGSPIPDVKTTYGDYTPRNYSGHVYYGINPARDALAKSYNVSAHYVYDTIIDTNPAKHFLEKMGINTLTEGDHSYRTLAIGSPTNGIVIKDNIGAFSTFGNDGEFIDDYMIDKITLKNGDIIYEHEQQPVEVFSPETAYLTIDMMRDVLSHGTGTYARSMLHNQSVDWAGKTGTSNDYEDLWFVATNPKVTFGTWIGYDTPHNLKTSCAGCGLSQSQRVQKLWADLLNQAATIAPDIITPKEPFQQPENVVESRYCAISGMLPSELCERAGLVKTDIFNKKYLPTEIDDSLILNSYNQLMFNPEFLKRNGYDQLDSITELYPRSYPGSWSHIRIPY